MLRGSGRARSRTHAALALTALTVLCACVASCGARTSLYLDDGKVELDAGSPPPACPGAAPQCVTGDPDDACAAVHLVDAQCDARLHTFGCPAGAWPYERAGAGSECLPLHEPGSGVSVLSGSLASVPTPRICVWIAEDVETSAGERLHNVAFALPTPRQFGACPQLAVPGGVVRSAVRFADGSNDPNRIVQITGGFRQNGKTRVMYRLFRVDPNAVFGATELGTGLADWDDETQNIVIPTQLRFGTDLDFADASFVDGAYAYLWGCNAPGQYLSRGCLLGRLDVRDEIEVYTGNDSWGSPGLSGAVVFDAGPWISSVRRNRAQPFDLQHVFVTDFDQTLKIQHAKAPEGPWGAEKRLGSCTLPAKDPSAFCAAPVVHTELSDPTRPAEIVVTYAVATTGTRVGGDTDYWPRLTWLDE